MSRTPQRGRSRRSARRKKRPVSRRPARTWGPGLAAQLAPQLDDGVVARGRECFRAGAVVTVSGDDYHAKAIVRDTSQYYVELAYAPAAEMLGVGCTCHYFFDREEPCKHIWAAILAADEKGFLNAARTPGVQVALLESEADDYDQEDPDEDPDFDAGPFVLPGAAERLLGRAPSGGRGRGAASRGGPKWKRQLDTLRERVERTVDVSGPAGDLMEDQLLYILDPDRSKADATHVRVEVARRRRNRNGRWSVPRRARLSAIDARSVPDLADQVILSLLAGARDHRFGSYGYYGGAGYSGHGSSGDVFFVPGAAQPTILEKILRTGRCAVRSADHDRDPAIVTWDEGDPWELWLQVDESPRQYTVSGSLRRGQERMALGEPLVLGAGVLVTRSAGARFDDGGGPAWAEVLRREERVKVPRAAGEELLARLLRVPRLPKLDLPPSLRYEQVQGAPRPRLMLSRSRAAMSADALSAALSFAYEGGLVGANERGSGILLPRERWFLLRDSAAEAAAVKVLREAGFHDAPGFSDDTEARFMISAKRLPEAVRVLVGAGWHVEASGNVYRSGSAFKMALTSGVDWFDLHVEASFGDRVANLPELLAALRHGEQTVRLDDGSFGVLPQEWLKRLGLLADLGTAGDGRLRFGRTQIVLLDALLAAQPQVSCDAAFAAARKELCRFEGIKPRPEPKGFVGTLRPYQREGLGWLEFLQQFRFGGCLADDMGLGKTVQVLALLEARRTRRAPRKEGNGAATAGRRAPSLVVVPRSLVFNWKREAERFAPGLRVLDHTGIGRTQHGESFDGCDLVLTTYGTLRRDIAALGDVHFDYVILDEAQAIKNADTQSAKAARLLRADHRLAMSGTPIENHLGELWSLFEFLNPGMLGRGRVLVGPDVRDPGEESRRLLAAALRPFILRRTKEQVAPDLPSKLEQTLYCDLLPRDRRRYDELRDHFRASVLGRVERDGLNRSRMHVLEALLRLRQAACHCGLIDKSRTAEPSAKLELLLPQVQEVIDEGHKALVFSQFTSLLAIVRDRLDKQGVTYEYLDGKTRDRQARVDRFQTEPGCGVFLISLKAGGLGLNLTAAEYVFLLDPWWNPAVEAQAVDRAHRIGQTRAVFAFRLIARDTVEEKVLQLQDTKRSLARDIISSDDSLVRSLTREDLERLLS